MPYFVKLHLSAFGSFTTVFENKKNSRFHLCETHPSMFVHLTPLHNQINLKKMTVYKNMHIYDSAIEMCFALCWSTT